jgi:hypothetical protein
MWRMGPLHIIADDLSLAEPRTLPVHKDSATSFVGADGGRVCPFHSHSRSQRDDEEV